MQTVALFVAIHVIVTATIKKVSRTGPRMSPCFTPITDAIVIITSSTVNFTLKSLCNALNKSTSFLGTPNLVSIIHNSSLGTRSKALTRSRNNIHGSKPCSLRFLMAAFMVKIAPMQPLPGRNRIVVHGLGFLQ